MKRYFTGCTQRLLSNKQKSEIHYRKWAGKKPMIVKWDCINTATGVLMFCYF